MSADELHLGEVRTETWGGFVFVNFDPDAPSLIGDEFPAVTVPPAVNAGFRPASTSTVESSRMPSSRART